jgi:MFS family permease
MSPGERTRITFLNDAGRMFCAGILESAGNTFLLLIAVTHFKAGPFAKALVAGAGSFGLLMSPVAVSFVQRRRWKATTGVARFLGMGALCCVLMAVVPQLWLYVPACLMAMTLNSAIIPLMTETYHHNYPSDARGKLYARAFTLRIGGAMLAAWIGGHFLDAHPQQFPLLLLGFGVAFGLAAVCARRIPSSPLHDNGAAHPLHAMRFVREDRVFRQTLIVWMFMGFANLMMLPMRVEYLGNPAHGLAKSAAEIAFLTGVVPNIARLVMNPVWGWLFDRMNFFALRTTLNIGFALGILAFFTSNTTTGLIVGAIIYGISNAGGDVAWGLWVTKFAPPGRVADYMGVHTFLTGVRGIAAPMIAFQLVQHYSLAALGGFSALLIVAATLLLLPEIGRARSGNKGEILTEEVVD